MNKLREMTKKLNDELTSLMFDILRNELLIKQFHDGLSIKPEQFQAIEEQNSYNSKEGWEMVVPRAQREVIIIKNRFVRES